MPQPRHFTQQKFRKTRHVKNRITQCFHELLTLLHADATKSQRCIKHNKNQHWQKRSQKKRITYKKQLEAKSNKKKNRTRSRSKKSYSSRSYSSKSETKKNDQSSYTSIPHSQNSANSKYST